MKTDPGDVAAQARDAAGLVQPEIRTCPACGTQFPASGDSGLCPVCILREAAGEESAATGIPSSEFQRTCPSCGSELSGTMQFCPVCMLRKALPGGVESGESSAAEVAVDPTPEQTEQRFEHYRLVTGEDGKPVELGRGAMGVTYKAFDVDLHCPVTLKVISDRYLADESARLRFFARGTCGARVRHPNVAWVLHLGRTGSGLLLRDGVRRGRNAGETH